MQQQDMESPSTQLAFHEKLYIKLFEFATPAAQQSQCCQTQKAYSLAIYFLQADQPSYRFQ